MYVCMYVSKYVSKYVCMYVSKYVCMYVCMLVNKYVCMYVSHIYMYIPDPLSEESVVVLDLLPKLIASSSEHLNNLQKLKIKKRKREREMMIIGIIMAL